jgi:hypothetical protein
VKSASRAASDSGEKACYETNRRDEQFANCDPDATHTRSVGGVGERAVGSLVALMPRAGRPALDGVAATDRSTITP